ncbi:MAG: hypothetical protein IJ184_02660 [Alphaproteobacteria bacterium]|nr:hypothetical protein [Alphaproteobacteria bacterium]
MAAKSGEQRFHRPIENYLAIELALLDYARVVNISEDDIRELYEKVAQVRERINDNTSTDDDWNIVEEYELYDIESIQSVDDLREKIKNSKEKIATSIFEGAAFAKTGAVVGNVLSQLGVNKNEVVQLTDAIVGQKLEENVTLKDKSEVSMAELLAMRLGEGGKKSALQKIINNDFKVYETLPKNEFAESLRPRIEHYLTGNAGGEVINYKTSKQDKEKQFRDDVRGEFRKIRPDFIQLTGTMLLHGRNQTDNMEDAASLSHMQQKLEDIYGKDKAPAVLREMLEIGKDDDLRAAYDKKCSELYGKFMVGVLSLKMNYNRNTNNNDTNYSDYADTINRKFIENLAAGRLTKEVVMNLCFATPDESNCDANASGEKQAVSVHHKMPVGSGKGLTAAMRKKGAKLPEYDEVAAASELVNKLGNFCLVIGTEMHQSIEARGRLDMGKEHDDMVFAAKVFDKTLMVTDDKGCKKMADFKGHEKISPNLMKLIERYGKEKMVICNMRLPSSPVIEKYYADIRNQNQEQQERKYSIKQLMRNIAKRNSK